MAIDTHGNLFGQLGFDSSTAQKESFAKALPVFQPPLPPPLLSSGELIQKAIDASESLLSPNPTRTKGRNPHYSAWRDSFIELESTTSEILEDPVFWKVVIGCKIVQVAAGSHHTLLQTSSGQIWGFGANGYGQLGKHLPIVNTIPSVIIPCFSTPVKKIWAGGDTSAYLTESNFDGLSELYTLGAGIWGQLGNNTFRQIQSTMVPVTDISRLTYYDENSKRMTPISLNSLSMGHTHVAAVIKTSVDNRKNLPHFGFNVFTWGSNHVFQLGNGKRSMSSRPIQPNALPTVKMELADEGVSDSLTPSSSSPKIGLQVFPGIFEDSFSEIDQGKKEAEYIIPPQKIACGHDTTAIY